jgi:hypothetical protein
MKTIPFFGHAGAVGTGKTLHWIEPSINHALAAGDHVLQVVAGLENQKEILIRYPNAHVLNYINKSEATVIGEAHRIITAKRHKHLVITKETFTRLRLSYEAKCAWVVYTDETFETYRTITHNSTPSERHSNYHTSTELYDLTSVIQLTGVIGDGYHAVKTTIPADSILHESKTLQKLADQNWNTEVNGVEYAKIGNAAGVTEFYQSINGDVLKGWKQVYIAGANFDNLEFGYWLKENKFEPEHIEPFEKRDGKVVLYTTPEFNSKYLQQTDPTFMQRYHTEYEKIITDRKVLRLRNESTNTSTLQKSRVIDQNQPTCTILKHNMHGLNEYRNSHDTVSFESALNSTKGFTNWMQRRHGIPEEVIFMTRTVDIAYQLIGRTAYRNPDNTNTITAGIPCKRTAHLLAVHYLKDAEINVFEHVVKARGNKKSTKPLKCMTPAERKAYNNERQRIHRATGKRNTDTQLTVGVIDVITGKPPLPTPKKANLHNPAIVEPIATTRQLTIDDVDRNIKTTLKDNLTVGDLSFRIVPPYQALRSNNMDNQLLELLINQLIDRASKSSMQFDSKGELNYAHVTGYMGSSMRIMLNEMKLTEKQLAIVQYHCNPD